MCSSSSAAGTITAIRRITRSPRAQRAGSAWIPAGPGPVPRDAGGYTARGRRSPGVLFVERQRCRAEGMTGVLERLLGRPRDQGAQPQPSSSPAGPRAAPESMRRAARRKAAWQAQSATSVSPSSMAVSSLSRFAAVAAMAVRKPSAPPSQQAATPMPPQANPGREDTSQVLPPAALACRRTARPRWSRSAARGPPIGRAGPR